jgi:ribosomal protein S18 acetylase RimI-like enzyme
MHPSMRWRAVCHASSDERVANIVIRTAAVSDSEAIALLVSDLGYATSAHQMRRRLETILADADYHTLVACDGEDIVGFIGSRIGPLYEGDGLYGQIMALAVAADQQRRGIGRMLVLAVESSLESRGVRMVAVASGNHRAEAHAFYESCGYRHTGRRYKKFLGASQ